ncbi:hypothetical protein DYH09_07655 [bacterium CPR1]|nr:hypothetical protein [bacterium CPR1]
MRFRVLPILLVTLALALMAQADRTDSQLTSCTFNLKNIAAALERYATEHEGEFPKSLSALTPEYLKSIPKCPAAGKDTYSASYHPDKAEVCYRLCCSGDHHARAGLKANQPAYDGKEGLGPKSALGRIQQAAKNTPSVWTTACKSNLLSIATALERYSTDNQGRYPVALSALTPKYLRRIPSCPAAGADSYSASYQMSSNPDAFTLCCQGSHHRKVGYPPNHPAYTSVNGLIQK